MTRPRDDVPAPHDLQVAEPLPTVERAGPCRGDVPDPVLERLRLVGRPSLASLVRWSRDADDEAPVLVHAVPAGAVRLGSLRGAGPWRAGHALTVGLAVTAALEALHDAGLAHGAVDGEQVLVAPDGSVVLAGCGLAWGSAVRPGDDLPDPAGDVLAVGRLVRRLLGPAGAPGPLVMALLRASDPDVSLRPSAAELGTLLRACGPAAPLLELLWQPPAPSSEGPPGPPAGPAPGLAVPHDETGSALRASRAVAPRPSLRQASAPRRRVTRARPLRRAPVRPLLLLLAVVLAGAAAVRFVAISAASADEASVPPPVVPASAPAAPPSVDVPDWAAVLETLDAGRLRALAAGSADELSRWVDPSAPAWGRDRALLDRLAASGASLSGGSLVLEEVRLLSSDADRTLLAVRDRRTAYDVLSAGATTHVEARGPTWWRVTLAPLPSLDGPAWRIADVVGDDTLGG